MGFCYSDAKQTIVRIFDYYITTSEAAVGILRTAISYCHDVTLDFLVLHFTKQLKMTSRLLVGSSI